MGVVSENSTESLVERESILTVPQPGELYWAYLESDEDPRPVIIVSRSGLNQGDYVVAVQLTSKNLETRWSLPNTVPFRAGDFKLKKNCVAQCEAITIVEKQRLDIVTGPFARLDDTVWRELVRAIGNVICADCEPT